MKPLAMFLAVAIGAVATIASTQDAGEETKSQITTISGTVSAYEPGRVITVLRPNATTVTYTIDASSTVPAGLAKGRKVVIRTITRPGIERPVVRQVTYSKKKKETKKETKVE
jgi:hypothetical protein